MTTMHGQLKSRRTRRRDRRQPGVACRRADGPDRRGRSELPEDRVAIVVFSGDLDRVLAGFILATGAAAMGQQVTMFFTFWGYGALRRQKRLAAKTLAQKMMAVM
jgi:hypothetical protein